MIVVVGCMNSKWSGGGIADGFESLGLEVYRIAADFQQPKKCDKFDLHLIDYVYKQTKSVEEIYRTQLNFRVINMETIITDLQKTKTIDFIFVCQVQMSLDFRGIDLPIYYYYTEITEKRIIPGTITGIFYAFVGADGILKLSFPYEFQRTKFTKLIPYGLNQKFLVKPDKLTPWHDRKNTIGFMGQTYLNQGSTDPLMQHLYDTRNDVLAHLSDNYPQFVFRHAHASMEEYAAFMCDTKIAVNVPGELGKINQRQYEAWAFGCILLQYDYPELKQLGFENEKNCYIFKSMESLDRRIKYILSHPIEAEQVRQNGIESFSQLKCDWKGRCELMLDYIHGTKLTDREKERIEWLKQDQINRNQYNKLALYVENP